MWGSRSGYLVIAYRDQHGVDGRIARIFNTYGPRMGEGDGRVVSNFIGQALRGDALTIYGTGDQTRSLCYQSDLVSGLVALMGIDANPGPVNLGNPEELTIRAIAELVIALTGSRSTIEHRELPADDPARRRPDISKARALLGWEPVVPARQGLEETIDDVRARPNPA